MAEILRPGESLCFQPPSATLGPPIHLGRCAACRVYGLPCATIDVLNINAPYRIDLRELLIIAGRFPPE